jgi:deoxyribonuclease-4
MEENNIKRENIVIHAPYLINGAKSEKFSFSKKLLDSEINRTKQMGFKMIVLHPGSNENKQQGIKDLIYFINEVNKTNDDVIICLETMSGKGNEIGVNLNELKEIFDGINKKNMIGFCLDTCHMHDSGIEIAYFSDYLDQFDKMIGLEYIKCLHINDSLNELGSHKDRHANLGYGKIGFDNLINVIYNEKLINVPKILETP